MNFLLNQSLNVDLCIEYLTGEKNIFEGDNSEQSLWRSQIRALSKAITFVESDYILSEKLLGHKNLTHIKNKSQAKIIGLTGLPGAGKSSLTNLLVKKLRAQNKRVAVLCVDPSSQISGGAILGDRVRMQEHFKDDYVFIRSMGSRGVLGGLSQAARGALGLIKLLNFDYILLESVGVGQSESDIIYLADTTVLVLMPNSGDEIQLMKAGLLQLAHIFVVNKCDLTDPSRMMQELEENFIVKDENAWTGRVLKTSCTKNIGADELLEKIQEHLKFTEENPQGVLQKNEKMKQEVLADMLFIAKKLFSDKLSVGLTDSVLTDLKNGTTTSMVIATKLFGEIFISAK